MSSYNIAAIHDRIDEEHFEMRLHASAIQALQQRVLELEAAVRELRRLAFNDGDNSFIEDARLAESFPRRVRTAARRSRRRNLQS